MDIGAYLGIGCLDELAKKNNIDVPRLRGYRLMVNEKPVDYKEFLAGVEKDAIYYLCEQHWGEPYTIWEGPNFDKYIKNYKWWWKPETAEGYREPEIRWDRLKGKRKRMFKTEVKNRLRDYKKQYEVWNRYCGRDDILYIHSRIGGGNWPYYYQAVIDKPWFIEKVDDAWDCTYCDIYAKIQPVDPEFVKALEAEDEEN